MARSSSNPNVPQIPTPLANLGSLVNVCQALKQGVDSLGGSRGSALDRAVTLNDLVSMGVLTGAAAQSLTGQASGGSGSGSSAPSALSQLSDVSLGTLANGQVLTYDSTAAKWKNIAAAGGGSSGGDPIKRPALASLSWLNQGTATAVEHAGGPITITRPPTPGDNCAFLGQAAPTAPWTLTTRIRSRVASASYTNFGIGVADASGKMHCMEFASGGTIRLSEWNSLTSYHSPSNSEGGWSQQVEEWARVYCDGTNIVFSLSPNGADWIVYATAAIATWVVNPAYAGVYVTVNGTSLPSGLLEISWFALELGLGTNRAWS